MRGSACAAAIIAFLATALAGCGGTSEPTYAGMAAKDVRSFALSEADSESKTPGGTYDGDHITLVRIEKRHDPSGAPAWRALFLDSSRRMHLCLWFTQGEFDGSPLLSPCVPSGIRRLPEVD